MKYIKDQKLIYSSKVTKYTRLHGLTIFILLLIAAALLWTNYSGETAKLHDVPAIQFEGEYRIGDGPWKPLNPDTHISSTKGDVILRGYFFQQIPESSAPETDRLIPVKEGTHIAMYSNHIQIEVTDPLAMSSLRGNEEAEHTVFSCGKFWTIFKLEEASERPVTIVLKNPHRFGNATAVDELLDSFTIYLPNEFEQGIREIITPEKILGLIYVIMAMVQLAAALFSILLQFGDLPVFSMSGFTFFFAGGMFLFGSPSMHFQNQQIIMNTTFLGICLILYVFFMTALSACFLYERWRKAGHRLVAASGILTAATFLIPMVSGMLFYDVWFWWASLQVPLCLTMAYLLIRSIPFTTGYHRLNSIVFLLVMLALLLDYTAVSMGWWGNIYVSKVLFSLLFIGLAAVLIWKMPKNIHAAAKARELEKQQIQLQSKLQETRVAIIISQIKPHFIYNTLGTIEQLCLEDPEGASRLVHNFSRYLRGNFSELDSTVPIRFSQELSHVKYYTEIE